MLNMHIMPTNIQIIQSKIYQIRWQRVMLDFDLAQLYETTTKALKQAVRRNIERFPEDFMFTVSFLWVTGHKL